MYLGTIVHAVRPREAAHLPHLQQAVNCNGEAFYWVFQRGHVSGASIPLEPPIFKVRAGKPATLASTVTAFTTEDYLCLQRSYQSAIFRSWEVSSDDDTVRAQTVLLDHVADSSLVAVIAYRQSAIMGSPSSHAPCAVSSASQVLV
jgi:hypothetical protein